MTAEPTIADRAAIAMPGDVNGDDRRHGVMAKPTIDDGGVIARPADANGDDGVTA